jgi:spermidine/putrescine-binding protein
MRHGGFAAGALLCIGMVACGQHKRPSGADTLNVSNFGNFIAPDTVANFERETGVKVHYTTYGSDAVLETKLLTGHTDYDVVVPYDTTFDRLVKVGMFRKLPQATLESIAAMSPDIMRDLAVHDPGNLHGVPYLWTTTGIGYNVDMIRARLGSAVPDSWSLLLDPKNAERLQDCGIMIVDSPSEVYSVVLIYLGKDPNSEDPRDINLAADTLQKIRPYVRTIASEGIVDGFSSGGLCIILGWAGDISLAKKRAAEASKARNLRYFVPREGSLIGTDVIAIPIDAPHVKNAERFLNYLITPRVIASITNAVRYPNAVEASLAFVDEDIKKDTALYPDIEQRATLHTGTTPSGDTLRLVNRLWTRFRTGQ